MAIVTLDEIKTYLNKSGTTDDTFLQTCLDNAQSEVQEYLGYSIVSTSTNYTTYGNNDNEIQLPYAIPFVVNKVSKEIGIGEFEEIPSTDYDLYRNHGVRYLKLDGIFSVNTLYIIEGNLGFLSSAVPDALKEVLIEWAVWLYKMSSNGENLLNMVNDSQNIGGVSSTKTYNDIFKNLRQRCRIYRFIPV